MTRVFHHRQPTLPECEADGGNGDTEELRCVRDRVVLSCFRIHRSAPNIVQANGYPTSRPPERKGRPVGRAREGCKGKPRVRIGSKYPHPFLSSHEWLAVSSALQ